MTLVIDASQALAWLFADELSSASDAMLMGALEESVVVPPHWWIEVANGALMGERRERTTREGIVRWREQLELLDVQIDDDASSAVFDRILPLARAHRLTIYDTLYLELAERRGATLVSRDKDLAAAARTVGLDVITTGA